MQWTDDTIVIHSRPLGEYRHIVTCLTRERGCWKGAWYGRSRVPFPGLHVQLSWKGRTEDHLGQWTMQDLPSFSTHLYEDQAALQALFALCALCVQILPERAPMPNTFLALSQTLNDLSSPQGLRAYIYFEAHILCESGYGRANLFTFLDTWKVTPYPNLLKQLTYHSLLFQDLYPDYSPFVHQRHRFLKPILRFP